MELQDYNTGDSIFTQDSNWLVTFSGYRYARENQFVLVPEDEDSLADMFDTIVSDIVGDVLERNWGDNAVSRMYVLALRGFYIMLGDDQQKQVAQLVGREKMRELFSYPVDRPGLVSTLDGVEIVLNRIPESRSGWSRYFNTYYTAGLLLAGAVDARSELLPVAERWVVRLSARIHRLGARFVTKERGGQDKLLSFGYYLLFFADDRVPEYLQGWFRGLMVLLLGSDHHPRGMKS